MREEEKKNLNKPFVKVARACGKDGLNERWAYEQVNPTLNTFDLTGDSRVVVLIVKKGK